MPNAPLDFTVKRSPQAQLMRALLLKQVGDRVFDDLIAYPTRVNAARRRRQFAEELQYAEVSGESITANPDDAAVARWARPIVGALQALLNSPDCEDVARFTDRIKHAKVAHDRPLTLEINRLATGIEAAFDYSRQRGRVPGTIEQALNLGRDELSRPIELDPAAVELYIGQSVFNPTQVGATPRVIGMELADLKSTQQCISDAVSSLGMPKPSERSFT